MTTNGAAAGTLDARRELRSVFGRYATGVTVVTSVDRGQLAGLTVNSFTSLSLDPPLVLWCLHCASETRPVFMAAEYFAVNILAEDQQDIAVQFAAHGDRFRGVPVRTGPYGLPLLDRTVGTVVCRRERAVPAGDHIVMIGLVEDYWASQEPPLLFMDGRYRSAALLRLPD